MRSVTWRTIQTWYTRYQKYGLTAFDASTRSHKGALRKLSKETLLSAVQAVSPKLHGKTPKRATIYRLCIEAGLFTHSQMAPNIFSRLVKELEMLKPDAECEGKRRLAFAKEHANQMWQADTLLYQSGRRPPMQAWKRL